MIGTSLDVKVVSLSVPVVPTLVDDSFGCVLVFVFGSTDMLWLQAEKPSLLPDEHVVPFQRQICLDTMFEHP